jgi:hypothetical protein
LFKSLDIIKFIRDTNSVLWNLVDDDFQELIETVEFSTINSSGEDFQLQNKFIYIYERRKLNVPANIVLYFKFLEKDWFQSVESQIKNNLKYNPLYTKYHNEVEKYLLLI